MKTFLLYSIPQTLHEFRYADRKRSGTPIERLGFISMESQKSILLLYGYELAFVLWFVEL